VNVLNLHHVTVVVTDVAQAIEFYGLFGFHEVPRPSTIKVPGAWLDRNGQMIHIVCNGQPPAPGAHHFAMTVDDLDAAVAELRAKGVKIGEPRPVPGVGRQVNFADPEGNGVELNELLVNQA
jgi:catechol 2,3-dioxygenase-like lactoylglutathione lyase family enzyme